MTRPAPPKPDQEPTSGAAPVMQDIVLMIKERFVVNIGQFLVGREPQIWLLALLIGSGVAYAALVFRLLIGVVQWPWLLTMSENVASAARDVHWSLIVLAPMAGGLLVGLILHFIMPGRRAEGVADVIEADALREGRMPLGSGLLSAGVTILSLGSGASAGREGPVVHLGATLASQLQYLLKLPVASRRILLACGVAAAVSSSFNAPIAGVLFAHEVILRHYAMRALVPVVIASVIGAVIARVHLGNFPAFVLPAYHIQSYLEFPAFFVLGIVAALVAILFQFLLIGTERAANKLPMPLWLRPVAGGALIGGLAVYWPEILGVGYEATDEALKGALGVWVLLALLGLKALATAITLASRFGGGVFSPSLYLGAMAGGAFGFVVNWLEPGLGSAPGLYAILGMGAVAGAVLGAPVSTILIVFELTGGYDMTIALLLTVTVATGLTHAVHGGSFFHWQLNLRGIFLQGGPHRLVMMQLKVADFMTPATEGDQQNFAEEPKAYEYVLYPGQNLQTALRLFDQSGQRQLPVMDPKAPERLLGWATHMDALALFNKALLAVNDEAWR